MTRNLTKWLTRKWQRQSPDELRDAYRLTFATLYGQQVLQHLMDTIYCQVYEGTDPHAALAFNAKRALVHDILVNIDLAEAPEKYTA